MGPERITCGYGRLFQVRILHHYWLDDGATSFDLLSEPVRNSRLLRYDVRKFLKVSPTPSTERLMAGLGCIFREGPLGIVVAAPRGIAIPDDLLFEFVVEVTDAEFFNYTALTLLQPATRTLYNASADKTLRFRENAPLYSNLTGTSRGNGSSKGLYLSREYPPLADGAGSDRAESLVVDGGALFQLMGDQPGAAKLQLGSPVSDLPVYANQGDIPPIVPPAGTVGTPPPRGLQLSDEIGEDLYALIRIAAVASGDPDFSLTSGGIAKDPGPLFQIRLKNRSTIWRYFDKSNPGPATGNHGPFPLTYFGNATSLQKPDAGIVTVDRAGPAISAIVSDVHV